MSQVLKCHHCSHFMGESADPVEFVGMFDSPRDRDQVEGPRSSWRCPSCKWINVFRRRVGAWRELATKA